MKLLAGLVIAQAAAIEPCNYEELINFECHTNSAVFSLKQPLEESDIPSGCSELINEATRISTESEGKTSVFGGEIPPISMQQALNSLITDQRLYIDHVGNSDDNCILWDGKSLYNEISYTDSCLNDTYGVISGNLYLHEVINGEEIVIDQPVSFSCSPSQLTIVSAVYTTMDEVTTHEGLHRQIEAPYSYIDIFDLSTGEEAKIIKRGHHYQAVVSLGDELYEGLEMNINKCEVIDQNGMVDAIIVDNEMAEGFDNNVEVGALDKRIMSYMTISEETTFAFYFNGFGRKGADSFQIKCQVNIDSKQDIALETTDAPTEQPTEAPTEQPTEQTTEQTTDEAVTKAQKFPGDY